MGKCTCVVKAPFVGRHNVLIHKQRRARRNKRNDLPDPDVDPVNKEGSHAVANWAKGESAPAEPVDNTAAEDVKAWSKPEKSKLSCVKKFKIKHPKYKDYKQVASESDLVSLAWYDVVNPLGFLTKNEYKDATVEFVIDGCQGKYNTLTERFWIDLTEEEKAAKCANLPLSCLPGHDFPMTWGVTSLGAGVTILMLGGELVAIFPRAFPLVPVGMGLTGIGGYLLVAKFLHASAVLEDGIASFF